MAVTRIRVGKQLQTSTSANSVLVTDDTSEALWLAPSTGADRILWYDHANTAWANLSIGTNLSISSGTLNATAGAGGYATIQEEGTDLTVRTKLNFVGSGFTATDDGGGARTNVSLDADLSALADLTTNGVAARTGAGTWATRTITGTASRLSVTNGDGVSGNPTLDIDTNVAFKNANETISGSWTFSNNIVLSGTPTLDSHVINLGVLKSYLQGLDPKASVRIATTAAGTLATSFENGDVIDGITLATNDRILIKDQAAQAENGIYTVNASGAPTRALDMDAWTEVPGSYVAVEVGTTNADTVWLCTADQGGTLNTTAITWVKWKSAGAGIDGTGVVNQVAFWSDTDSLTGNTNFIYDSGNLIVGHTTAATSTRFTTRGTATGAATYGYTHQNSSGTNVFRIADDGTLSLGATPTVTMNTASTTFAGGVYTIQTTGGQLQLDSNSTVTINGGSTTSNLPAVNMSESRNSTSSAQSNVYIGSTFNPAGAGTNDFTDLTVTPTINQTGGHTGVTRGLLISPTLTAATDFRALEIFAPGATALRTNSGIVRFDLGSDATGDVFYRNASGNLTRLAIGTASQVLVGGTIPSWGSPITSQTEAFIENQTGTTVDLDANSGAVKDVDGNNIAFTAPSDLTKIDVYRNGQLIHRDGTMTTRDYTINTSTHVITFATSLVATDVIYLKKIA